MGFSEVYCVIIQMENAFNLCAKEYDEWFVENQAVYLTELKALKKVIPTAEKGLEIGVGTGRFALPFDIYVGIDPSQEMLSIAEKRGIKAILGKGESLPFRDEEFDYALVVTTLCFAQNPKQVIKEARRVIKKGGKLVIGMIDRNSPLGGLYEKKDSLFYKVAKFFSVAGVMKLLERNGFGDFLTYQTIFRYPSEVRQMEKVKEGYGEGSFVVISGDRST